MTITRATTVKVHKGVCKTCGHEPEGGKYLDICKAGLVYDPANAKLNCPTWKPKDA
jgi:hypothetical protein